MVVDNAGSLVKQINSDVQLDEEQTAKQEVPQYNSIWNFMYQAIQLGATFTVRCL